MFGLRYPVLVMIAHMNESIIQLNPRTVHITLGSTRIFSYVFEKKFHSSFLVLLVMLGHRMRPS